jgi:Ohr subfamily peroxiredoxin
MNDMSITNSGGRSGIAYSTDGRFEVALGPLNLVEETIRMQASPEQLFAAAFASSFSETLLRLAGEGGFQETAAFTVTAEVSVLSDEEGECLEIELDAYLPGLDREKAQSLTEAAHEHCPYSQAVLDNVTVHLHLLEDE